MRNKPRIRFKGFTEDWEQCKLSDLMEVTSVKRIHQVDWTDSGVRFFRARDIVSSMNNEEIDNPVFISKDKYEEYSRVSGKVIEGDLLVTGVGTIGVPYLIKDTTPLYFKDGNIIWFKNNNTLNGSYFYYCFQNSYIQNQIYSASGKGTVGTYTIENGKKTSIRYPSLKEQIKIGNLLDTMTTMITLHQRKLEKLKLAKKALLQKLFPKNGSKFPELRFKGFADAWEQRKLGDIATITGGGTPSTNISEYWNGDIDWYSPVEIGEKRYASGSIRKITKLGLEKSSAKILPVGTVLFTSRAGIGNTAILQVEGCTNQGFQSITPNSKELDTYFLYTMTPKLKRYGEVTGAGSTFVEVSGKQMEQMNLMIPSLDEQKHVSQLFKVMDDAITLHQRKLDKLQDVKKGLLQKMFV